MGEETVISEGAATAQGKNVCVQTESCREEVSYIALLVFCGSQLVVAVEVSLLEHPASRTSRMNGVVLVWLADGPSSLHAFSLSLVEKLSLKDLISVFLVHVS